MTKRSLSAFARILACCALVVLCLGLCNSAVAAGPAAQSAPNSSLTKGPKIWLQENQPLSVTHVGPAAPGMSSAQPLSMAVADVDQDGVQDLLVGYSTPAGGVVVLHRGNLDAFAPQSEASFQAIGRGEFPAPFLPEAHAFAVPVTPDFIVVGDFTGHGMTDLAVAARGGSAIYVLAGDGKGHFTLGDTINLPGGVTALAAGRFGNVRPAFIVGVSSGRQSFLAVYGPGQQGLAPVAAIPLSAPASNLLFADFGDPGMDVAFLSGGKIQILRSSTGKLTTVALPVSVSAFALGSFIYDRSYGPQIALLTPDGSVQIAARNEFDPRVYTVEEFQAIRRAKINHQPAPTFVPKPSFPTSGWRIVEGFPGVSTVAAGQDPVFFRTRISVNGADDIMWLSASGGQMVVISHADGQPGAQAFEPGQVSLRPYSGTPIAALPMRLNVDGRLGVMALHSNQVAPSSIVPIPDPNFFVNTDNDPTPTSPIANACNNTSFTDLSSSCSLREAVLKANGDTIMLQAGHTYSLTIGKVTNDFSGNFGALYVNHTATIVGGNQNSTVITWGTPGSGTVDMVMAVNEDISPLTNATASLSNLTIQNGVNHGVSSNDGDGGCMEFDTGTSGTATLTLTNVTLQNCSTLQGGGGGLVIFNFTNHGAGGATISNSIIQGNSVANTAGAGSSAGIGGGIAVNLDAHMTMTNSQVLNNSAVQNAGAGGLGAGGGIIGFTPQNVSAATGESFIHSSTVSGNKAAGFGGGINTSASISIDQGTVISGNIAGTDGSNNTAHANQEGGGLYLNPAATCPLASTCTATLSKVTITGNKATGNGGGISYGNGSAGTVGALTMSFSRLAGNTTSGGSGSNFSSNQGTATVTNNWWGTNAASGTIHTAAGTSPTFDPFIVLTHTGSPQKIKINQSSTLTGDMSADNHGTAVGLANLTQIIGLPITFDSPVLGTIPQAQPETLDANAQATATFNAGGTSGLGTANGTVDQEVRAVNSNLIASATESGTTATITTVGAHGFSNGEFVSISGVTGGGTCSGYNGNFFSITATGATTFTYTAPSGQSTCSGGTANAGIIILQPPSITKSFSPKTIQTTAGTGTKVSTITFSITNGNVVPINVSFTDNLPANVGTVPGSLVVASTPNVTSTCGTGTTATAGSGTISFSNSGVPAGACTITVDVQSAVDNLYSNSVTVDSTDAGNGNTSSDTLNVINPPHITKSFGAATIPLNGTTSLTLTVSNPNQNQTLSGITFTDSLPAGLVVATPGNPSTTCTGTVTAPDGSSSVALASSSLAPGASCTVSVTMQGTTAGVKNNSVIVSDTTAGSGNTGNASLTVVAPPTIAKAYNPTQIALNTNSTLTVTIANPNTASALSGVAFTDTLPAGEVVATPNGVTGSCGSGTITATAGSATISLSGGTLTASPAAGSTCTFSVNVTGTAAGLQNNTSGAVTSTEGGTGITASASLTVVGPPSITKAFNPTAIPVNAVTTLTFTLTNPPANTVHELGVAFNDALPAGLVVATPNGLTNSCGGTPSATAGTTSISLTGGDINVNSSCTVVVNITSSASGVYINTSGAVSSTNGGTGNTASANLTVASPPSITKSFNPTSIVLNATSTLSFSITNPNTGVALSGVAFTDSLPSGLQVAATPNVTGSCGSGTITATAGSGSISLSGGTLTASPAAGSTCTFSVDVTGTTAGVKNNSVQVTSTQGGPGNTSNASLTVTPASTSTAVASSSTPSVFGQSVTFTATVTDTSAGSTAQPTGSVQFVVDGVNFGSPVALTGASSNSSTATSQATATLSVTGSPHTVGASYLNADGNFLNSSALLGGGQTVTIASTTTAVVSSSNPSVFGQSVTFTATITDISPGSTAQPTGSVQFVVDGVNFGAPVVPTGASSSSSTATSAATTTLTIAGSPHSVTANYVNIDGNFSGGSASLSGGQVVTQATSTITVSSSAGTITLGDKVTFTATVAANSPATGTPTGLVTFFDGSTPIASGTLNGSGQAIFATSLLAVGSHSIAAIYHGDANFSASGLSSPITETVNLRGSTTSVGLNPTTVGAGQASTITVTVTDGGSSTPPGTPDIFTGTGAPATGRTGFTSTLFADGLVLVAGGTDATNNVLKSAEIYSVSGAAFTAIGNLNTARTGAVAVLLPNGKVLVAGGSGNGNANGALNSAELFDPSAGTFTPTSHNMTTARFGTTATLLNTGKVLLAGGINSGGVLNSAELYDPATDTFTATGNLNAARTGPSATLLGTGKVLVAGGSSDGTANGALKSAEVFDPAGNAGAGTFASVAGANPTLATGRWQPEAALLLSGKVLVAGGQNSGGPLTTADLYDPAADSFTASAHQMNEGRANGSAVALPNGMVLLPGGTTSQTVDLYDGDSDQFNLTGSLLHHVNGSASTLLNNGDVLVVGINIDGAPTLVSDGELYSPTFNPLGTVGFGSSEPTDVFGPACVLVPSTATASTCTSTVTPIQVATSPHTITGTYPADAVHSGSSNTASLTVIPSAPPTIAKSFSAPAVGQNGLVNVAFTIVNPNPASTLTGISFTDSLPAGLVVANPNNLNSNCGGTFTAVPVSTSLSLTGGTVTPATAVPASGLCVITVDLRVTGTGTLNNITGVISANESGPGTTSNIATVVVVLAPTVNKAFGATSIPTGGTTSLTFNIANPNGATALIGIALNDTLPAGLVVATPNGLTGTCVAPLGATISAIAGSNSVNLVSLNLAAGGSCSYSVNVTGTSGGTKNNTTGPITGLFDDGFGTFRVVTGGTASASIVVVAPPSISKAFVPIAIAPGGVSALTFTITNPAVNTVAESGVGFTDTLPANVVIATPNGLSGSCGGTVTATAGTGTITLAGGSIAAASSCVFSVNVTSSVVGNYTNTTGAVSSTNGGTGNTATAALSVGHANLSITKTHVGNFPRNSTGNNYTITVSNDPTAPTVGTVTVTDTLPNVTNPLVATAMTGTGWSCTLTTLTCTRSDSLAPGASYPPITLTVTVPQNIQANVVNSAMVSGGNDLNSHTANDPTHIGPPVQLTPQGSNNAEVVAGGVTSVVITVDSNAGEGTLNMSCSGLPGGAACSFNPPSTSALSTQVTVIIGTTLGTSTSARPPASGPGLGLYAMLFPVFGVLLLGAGAKRDRKRLRRLVVVFGIGLLLSLLVLSGCGGLARTGTPATVTPVTITATSAVTGDSGSTTINLTVLNPAPTSH